MSFARYTPKTPLALIAAAFLAGCAGNGKGLDASGNPISGGGGTPPLTADFNAIQANIFTPICTKCHIGASAPEGLQLDAAHSYSLLVGVASNEQPSVLRVQAGDPDSSYIIRKLEGAPGITGAQMPFGGPYLPQSTIDVIRQWITNGAQQSATGAAGMSIEAAVKAVQHFGVLSTSPDDQSIVSEAVMQIVVACNGNVDSNLLNATTVTLERINSNSAADATQPLQVTTGVPVGNPAAILIKPQAPLTNGTYRVTLLGSLANQDAQALGDNYSFTFTVDTMQ